MVSNNFFYSLPSRAQQPTRSRSPVTHRPWSHLPARRQAPSGAPLSQLGKKPYSGHRCTSYQERRQVVGQIDGFAHLGKGGRPARGNDIPDLEAVAWSLWLASQACSSLNQPERLPMLDVLTYLFFEINNRITSKGAIRPSYRGSNAEELYGRLWSRLSFVGFDQALYNSSPMPNLEPSAELVSKLDQYIIYSLVRVLRGTLDYDFEKKNRKEEFDFTNLGGGAKKIHTYFLWHRQGQQSN